MGKYVYLVEGNYVVGRYSTILKCATKSFVYYLIEWRGDRPSPVPSQLGNGNGSISPPHRQLAFRETHLESQGARHTDWPIPIHTGAGGDGRGLWRQNGFLVNHPFPFGFSFSMNATLRAPYRNDCLSASSARSSWRRQAASSIAQEVWNAVIISHIPPGSHMNFLFAN